VTIVVVPRKKHKNIKQQKSKNKKRSISQEEIDRAGALSPRAKASGKIAKALANTNKARAKAFQKRKRP
jgi:hypothetical protein